MAGTHTYINSTRFQSHLEFSPWQVILENIVTKICLLHRNSTRMLTFKLTLEPNLLVWGCCDYLTFELLATKQIPDLISSFVQLMKFKSCPFVELSLVEKTRLGTWEYRLLILIDPGDYITHLCSDTFGRTHV
jgi:hypothetical protein